MHHYRIFTKLQLHPAAGGRPLFLPKEREVCRKLVGPRKRNCMPPRTARRWRRPVGWAAALWVQTLPQVSERRRRRAAGSAPQPYRSCPPTPHAHSPSDWLTDRDGRRAAALLERGNSCCKICLDHPYGLGHLTGGLDWIGFFFNLSWTKLDVDC